MVLSCYHHGPLAKQGILRNSRVVTIHISPKKPQGISKNAILLQWYMSKNMVTPWYFCVSVCKNCWIGGVGVFGTHSLAHLKAAAGPAGGPDPQAECVCECLCVCECRVRVYRFGP